VIADAFPEVTVLFADLVDFTRRSQRIGPAQVVATLNELFSAFDELAQRHGLEKIKTIGDAYMVAGMALAMQAEVARRTDPSGQPLQVRIGIDTGPVEAGVIGTAKFSYDLWGDTVNTARRMEPHGSPAASRSRQGPTSSGGRLPVPAAGTDPCEGHGEMVTYLLVERNR
jgi:adenylate cyclase